MIKIEYMEEEEAVFDITVEDNHNFYANNILVHNCNEIYLPTKAPVVKDSYLNQNLSTNDVTLVEESEPGLIALCNLSSINLINWMNMDYNTRDKVSYNLLRASDNLIDYAFYPAKEGEIFNRNYRAIGVGVTNYAQFLAIQDISWEDKKALKVTNDIMESIYWHLMRANIKLAQERGRFEEFYNTKYANGELTFDNYQGPYNFPLNYDWDALKEEMAKSGTRFSTLMSIAPTASSSLIMNSTEGIEPVRKLVSLKTGTYTCKQLVPNLRELRDKYDISWNINVDSMTNLASVRQRWIDQGQSYSTYYKDRNGSATEVLRDILYADKQGLKGMYYAHSPKEDGSDEEECESCSV